MSRDEILSMAREAGFVVDEVSREFQPNCIHHTYHMVDELLDRFAALVAERARTEEREACARLLEHNAEQCGPESLTRLVLETNAAAIRARG